MLQRMLLRGEVGLIRSPLLQYRLHGANTIRQDIRGLRTEIAQVVAEAYAAHRRTDGFDATVAAAVADLVQEQALGGAFEVWMAAVEQSEAPPGQYPTCDAGLRPVAAKALASIDARATALCHLAETSAAAGVTLLSEQGGTLPKRVSVLSMFDRIGH